MCTSCNSFRVVSPKALSPSYAQRICGDAWMQYRGFFTATLGQGSRHGAYWLDVLARLEPLALLLRLLFLDRSQHLKDLAVEIPADPMGYPRDLRAPVERAAGRAQRIIEYRIGTLRSISLSILAWLFSKVKIGLVGGLSRAEQNQRFALGNIFSIRRSRILQGESGLGFQVNASSAAADAKQRTTGYYVPALQQFTI
jgi:hypothetical protein